MYIKIVLKFSSQTSKSEMKPIYYAKKTQENHFANTFLLPKITKMFAKKKEYL